MPGKPIPGNCGSGCSTNIPSVGPRSFSRVLRGGAFNNPAPDVRCSHRNGNRPSNRNNTVGVRVASTSRRSRVSAWPESGGLCSFRACRCAKSRSWSGVGSQRRPGRRKRWPGGSGRPLGGFDGPAGRFRGYRGSPAATGWRRARGFRGPHPPGGRERAGKLAVLNFSAAQVQAEHRLGAKSRSANGFLFGKPQRRPPRKCKRRVPLGRGPGAPGRDAVGKPGSPAPSPAGWRGHRNPVTPSQPVAGTRPGSPFTFHPTCARRVSSGGVTAAARAAS
jgi:hypothetical protein